MQAPAAAMSPRLGRVYEALGATPPTREELTAQIQSDAKDIALTAVGVPPEAFTIIGDLSTGDYAAIVPHVALAAVRDGTFASCTLIAEGVTAGTATPAAPFICAAIAQEGVRLAAWVGGELEDGLHALIDLFSDEDAPPVDDAATGRLRGGNVPPEIRPLIFAKNVAFALDGGPFEGVWACRDIRGTTWTMRVYDRRGWVVGTLGLAAHENLIARHDGLNTARGRIERGADHVPYELRVVGMNLSARSLVSGYAFTGVRREGPPPKRAIAAAGGGLDLGTLVKNASIGWTVFKVTRALVGKA